MHRQRRGLVLAATLSVLVVGCIAEPIPWAKTGPLHSITARPAAQSLDVEGIGPLSGRLSDEAGEYGIRWWVTAGQTDCRIAVLLDGPSGRIVVDDYGRVAARQSASSLPAATHLDAATYLVQLDTDCPGESHLWMWRYLE